MVEDSRTLISFDTKLLQVSLRRIESDEGVPTEKREPKRLANSDFDEDEDIHVLKCKGLTGFWALTVYLSSNIRTRQHLS